MPTPLASLSPVTDPARLLATDAALAAIEQALDAVDHAGRRSLTAVQRLGLVTSSRALADRLESLAAVLLAEADAVDASMSVRGTPTTSWLTLHGARTGREASRLTLTAAEIAGSPAVRDAAITGRLTPNQAARLGRAVRELPAELTTAQRASAEQLLVERGLTTPAERIPRLVPDVITAVLAPTASPAEAEHRNLEVRRRLAVGRRGLSFMPDGLGSVLIRGSLPEAEASAVKKLVDSYVESDRRAERDQKAAHAALRASTSDAGRAADRTRGHGGTRQIDPEHDPDGAHASTDASDGAPSVDTDHAMHGIALDNALRSPGSANTRDLAAEHDARETRTPDQRRADALIRIAADLANTDHAPRAAGDRPRVVVIMRETDLRERAEQAAILDTGDPIAPGDLRRLCCDADLTPVVLGTRSEILDVGRTHRLVTPAIRRALTLRDAGCAFPQCSADAVRCAAHHIRPWWAGGETALNNLVLLCPHHHGIVEPPRFWDGPPPDRWQVRLNDHGIPEFLPPQRHDPTRRILKANRPPWAA